MLLLLVRHALTEWTGDRLSGWIEGIPLSEEGRAQAAGVAERLAALPVNAVYASPIDRCVETARAIASRHKVRVRVRDGLGEIRYGAWEGKRLATLAKTKLWRTVQHRPSAMEFPNGGTLREAQCRAVDTVEDLTKAHAKDTVVCVSHADTIRLVVAHYAGIHMDLFQRLAISPASVSALWIGQGAPSLLKLNETGGVGSLARRRR